MFQTYDVEKLKTFCSRHLFYGITCSLRDNVEKYGTSAQTTNVYIIRRTRLAFWMPKATDTHSEYVFHIVLLLETIVTWKYLKVTFIHTLPILFLCFLFCFQLFIICNIKRLYRNVRTFLYFRAAPLDSCQYATRNIIPLQYQAAFSTTAEDVMIFLRRKWTVMYYTVIPRLTSGPANEFFG